MKPILLFILLSPLMVLGQFAKGDKILGGSIQYSTNQPNGVSLSESESSNTSFSIIPELGVLLSDKFAISARLGYQYAWQKTTYSPSYRYTFETHGVSGNLRFRRFFQIMDKFYISLDANPHFGVFNSIRKSVSATFNQGNPAYLYWTEEMDYYAFGMRVMPVLCFFPSKNWAIETTIASLEYNRMHFTSEAWRWSFFDINYGSVTVGVMYYLRKKTE